MERVIDFGRMIFYIILAVIIYFGVNQLLLIAGPEMGEGWIESLKTNLAMAHPTINSVGETELIDRYLESKRSPMAGKGIYFVQYGLKYDIPPRLMVAMAGAESSFGRSGYAVGTYNAVGLGVHEGREYVSWEEGIEDMAQVLREYYFDEGRDDPVEIQDKWAPRCVDGNACHNSWADNVNYFLGEMSAMSMD